MGGEKDKFSETLVPEMGSPPHGRGKSERGHGRKPDPRITPAWAGKRTSFPKRLCRRWDHPRVGGEKLMSATALWYAVGSPPRRRGKAERAAGRHRPAGITSAWAGKRLTRPAMTGTPRDYPRVGGEKRPAEIDSVASLGSPPHRRGKAFSVLRRQFRFRITPAWAGKRSGKSASDNVPRDHPRMGGEKMHLSLTLAHDTLHALTQFFNRVAFVDKLQNRSE